MATRYFHGDHESAPGGEKPPRRDSAAFVIVVCFFGALWLGILGGLVAFVGARMYRGLDILFPVGG